MPADRHHRHQRQIDHHRADRASHRQRRPRRADGRQYRRAGAGAGAVRARPRLRAGSLVLPDRSGALAARRPSASCSTCRRTISTATAAWRITPRSRRWLPAQVEAGGTAVIGVDDRYTRDAAERIERAGKKVVRVSVQGAVARGLLRAKARASCAPPPARRIAVGAARRHRLACAARTMRRTPPARWRPASRSGSTCRPSRKGWRAFPASRTACSRSAAQRASVLFVNDFEGDQCRQRRQGAGELHRYFLDRRRQAEDRRHREPRRILPAHPQGLSDRRGGRGIRRDARRQGALRDRRRAVGGGRCRRARCRRRPA